MATRISTATRNAIVDSVSAKVDGGAGAGYVELRTGTQPATANDAATGTVLATVVCADPSFSAASSGFASMAGVPRSDVADATGTAGWFRFLDSAAATVMDGSVTGTGGGGDMVIDNPALVTGQTFVINSCAVLVA